MGILGLKTGAAIVADKNNPRISSFFKKSN
jgi:hypothetical protein